MNAVAPAADEARLHDMLARQRGAFLRDGPPPLDTRRADLLKLKDAILARRRQIERAISDDFGHRSVIDTDVLELNPLVQGIGYLRRNLARFMRPERRRVALHFLPGRARVDYQPLGVVGVISPWNFPFGLCLTPVATAIAAGNRVMVKPSEFTPASSGLIAELLSEIFSPEQVAVVTGDADVGRAFSALPFDHLVFTGATGIGKAVMRAASDSLTPVTLELGGKSPAVIAKDARLDDAARSIAYGKLANAGQICIAPDYVLAPEENVGRFVDAYDGAVRKLYPAGPASDDYSSIVSDRHVARLQALLDDARAKGALVEEVGVDPEAARDRIRTLAPTVVRQLTANMRLATEEIFGPVLPVIPYRAIDEAIDHINAGPRPLALYYFGDDSADRRRLLSRTTSGNVTINDTLMHYAQDDLPFGGVGLSGMGAYHGVEGFRRFSHARGVFAQSRWNQRRLTQPPFRRLTGIVVDYLLR